MANALIDALDNVTYTANGALTNASTTSACLDLLSLGGAYRERSVEDKQKLFNAAFNEGAMTATQLLFYLRDIRGGQGERAFFRANIARVADHFADQDEKLSALVRLIAEYGRWDDALPLVFNENSATLRDATWGTTVAVIADQLMRDKEAEHPSLLAKWLPSVNASSKLTRGRALMLASLMSLSAGEYRKLIAGIRRKLKLVESDMSAQRWGDIVYSHVPSVASMNYRAAFRKHDEERYTKYLEDVAAGKSTINAKVLYPHQIVGKAILGTGWMFEVSKDKTLEELWKALPDYTGDENALVVADVSGSMAGVPMTVSIGLALYFAERNTGAFKDYFMTFSARPKLQKIVGSTLASRIMNLAKADWEMNTDVNAVFSVILAQAKKHNVSWEEMPSTVYIISDMQFDTAVSDNTLTNFEAIRERYAESGYALPRLVFWNVNAFMDNVPVTAHDENTMLVSGSSPAVFKMVYESDALDPLAFMYAIVGDARYELVERLFTE